MESVRYALLSYPIEEDTPLYGNTPMPSITPHTKISKGSSSNSFVIKVHNHTGTHVDAPAHFVDSGRRISDYSPEELIFWKPVLIECNAGASNFIAMRETVEKDAKAKNAYMLLLRTGFGRARNEDVYRTQNLGIKSEEILWLRKEYPNVRAIGVDLISISSFNNREEGRNAHMAAFKNERGLGKPLLVIEDMNLLNLKHSDSIKKIMVVPWNIEGIDSAPCTVIAEIER